MDTQKNSRTDHHTNQFGDYPTAHITAHFLNGQVIDVETNKPVRLSNGALMHLKVYRKDILDEDIEQFETVVKAVLPKGARLSFILPSGSNGSTPPFKIIFRLRDILKFEKKSGKQAKALPCRCEIIEATHIDGRKIDGFQLRPFEVESLNQTFFQMSERLRPENKSHSCNIYHTIRMHPDGKYLDDLRF